MQKPEGIKAYRQASVVSASTAPDLTGAVLPASSQFSDMPTTSTELQTQPPAIDSAQSAPHLVNADREESKMLPTVSLSEVPLNIQQMLTSAPVQSEPAVSHEGQAPVPAAAETLQTNDASIISAQAQAMALRSLQHGMMSQSQQSVGLSPTLANQSQQSVAAMESASNVVPQDNLTPTEETPISCRGTCMHAGVQVFVWLIAAFLPNVLVHVTIWRTVASGVCALCAPCIKPRLQTCNGYLMCLTCRQHN